MSSESLALSDIWVGTPDEAEYDGVYAAVMATERGRWFLTEYASRNRHADTHAVLGALARLEAAVRGNGVALALGEAANGTERPLSPDIASAAERLQDIAFVLRERAVDAGLCDALDAAVREIAGVCGDRMGSYAGSQDTGGQIESAGDVAVRAIGEAAPFANAATPSTTQPQETAKISEADPIIVDVSLSSGADAGIALKPASDRPDADIAVTGRDNDPVPASANGSAKSSRWYIEPPDFAFYRSESEQPKQLETAPAENGHGHSLLPQTQLLPGPQDDPADLFESSVDALMAATAIVAPAPAIITPAAIAPPLLLPASRAPHGDPLAGLRALSEEEVIALFS